jgi:hypothetical protein
MSEAVERVARTISDAMSCDDAAALYWGYDEYPERFREVARAAIAAMREPTEAMLEAGPADPYMDKDVWARMIDAALAPSASPPPEAPQATTRAPSGPSIPAN